MPLIDISEVPLESSDIDEFKARVVKLWDKGADNEMMDVAANCYDAVKLVESGAINDPDEYYDGLRVTLPTAKNELDSVVASVYKTTIPNNKYLGVERELTGEDITKMILLSMRATNWGVAANSDFYQCGLTGNTFTLFRNKKNFLEAIPVPLQNVRVYPKDVDLSKTNVIIQYKLSTLEMFTSQQGYIKQSVLALEEQTEGAGETPDSRADSRSEEPEHNPYNLDDYTLGAGFRVLEAHIPYMKLKSGKVLINVIAVVSRDGKHLLRYSEVPTSILFNRKMHTTWCPRIPGTFWGTGVVEPILALSRFLDNIWTIENIQGFENSLGGLMLDPEAHPEVENYISSWEKGIDPLWLVPGLAQNPDMLQRIPVNAREPYADKVHQVFSQIINQTSNAASGVGSNLSQAEFATTAKLQFNGASINLGAVARHLDSTYIEPTAMMQWNHIYTTMFKVISDEYGNVQEKIPNPSAIQWWLKSIGHSDEDIARKLNDQQYMMELSELPDESNIRATGTQASINKQETLAQFGNLANLILGNEPMAQYSKPEKFGRKLVELAGFESDDYILSDEEIQEREDQQAQEEEQANIVMQELASLTNAETGEPLTEDEINERANYLLQLGMEEREIQSLIDQGLEGQQQEAPPEEGVPQEIPQDVQRSEGEVLA